MQPDFNPEQAEAAELDGLIEKGLSFTVPRRSIWRRFGKPERTFVIQQPYLGTLDRLSVEFLKMGFDQTALEADPMNEARRLTAENANRCARIVAIAVLNSRWKIKWLTGLLAYYLRWRITPQKMLNLTMLINQISNVADFINSIRFLSATPRTTAPNRIEKKAGGVKSEQTVV